MTNSLDFLNHVFNAIYKCQQASGFILTTFKFRGLKTMLHFLNHIQPHIDYVFWNFDYNS